jgi:uncharacterized protein YxjI
MEPERLYCMHCGARIIPGATFCRICGAPVKILREHIQRSGPAEELIQSERTPSKEAVPSVHAETQNEYPPQEGPSEESSGSQQQMPQPAAVAVEAPIGEAPASAPLFDPSRVYYVLDRSGGGFGAGSLYDQKGHEIGHLYRRVISVRHSIEFREADNATVSAVLRKKFAAKDTMDIENGHERTLARVKMKIQKIENPAFWLEDLRGNLILFGEGDFEGFSFVVYDGSKNAIAEIGKAEKWKNIFLSEAGFDTKNKHGIVIHRDIECDRRFILPLVIAVEEALHEEHKTK